MCPSPSLRGGIEITPHNLAYLVALFTVNNKIKLELGEGRSYFDDQARTDNSTAPLLLNNSVVQSRESRVLLLLLVVRSFVAITTIQHTLVVSEPIELKHYRLMDCLLSFENCTCLLILVY